MRRFAVVLFLSLGAIGSTGCDELFKKDAKNAMEAAQKKALAGDFRGAIKLYEAALDGTAKTAEAHYRMATIYDEKLRSPVDALHHFERYLDYEPNGRFATEARGYKKDSELKLLTSLGKENLISQSEAARLKNENLSLRKSIVDLRALKAASPLPAAPAAKGEHVQKPIPPGARTHVVQSGETLASIARKYYKNTARWKEIQAANFIGADNAANIKPGQTLVIP